MQLRLDEEFIKIVDQILSYILDYPEDFFKLGKPEKNKEATARFIKKSFEGLKIAQKEITKNLLEIEGKIKETKGKDGILFFKEKLMRELANAIAFLIFGGEWAHFKPFIHKNMSDGFLSDRNIKSCIEFSEQVNKDPMKFAFINDLTSAIGFADITEVSFSKDEGYSIKTIEIKTGKKNAELIDLIHSKENPVILSSEKDLNQAKRIVKELHKISNFSKYRKTDLLEGDYNRVALDFQGNGETYIGKIIESLEAVSADEYKYIPTDFGIIQACCGFGFVKEMDLKHFVYHTKNQNWEECDYIKKPESLLKNIRDKAVKEPMAYHDLKLYSAVESIAYPSLEPLSLLFGREKTVDIISGRKSVYVYFDHEAFSQTLKKNGLKTKLVKTGYLLRNMHFDQAFLKEIPTFENKALVIFKDNKEAPLTFGFLFKMVYKFLSADMIAKMYDQTFELEKD